MASHGINRSEYALQSQDSAHRSYELAKLVTYQKLVSQVQHARASMEHTAATLELTSSVLKLNPEFYTIWNYRRQILQHGILFGHPCNPATIGQHLVDELNFLVPLMTAYPKCYWLWNQRLWVLDQATTRMENSESSKFWDKELELVGMMLRHDRRNFHGWMYRRLIIARMENRRDAEGKKNLVQQEHAYTTQMIKVVGGLGNYSAWHARSTLIARFLDGNGATIQLRKDCLEDELELLARTISTDPQDQSLWFYHRWLIISNTQLVSSHTENIIAPGMPRATRLALLREEIKWLLELLNVHSECRYILKALVTYLGTLGKILQEPMGDNSEEGGGGNTEGLCNDYALLAKRKQCIKQLIHVDPLRAGRYLDMEYG